MAIVLQIIIGILILGVLVVIHELGHFVMAKACGIRVLAFSVGFGKVLVKKVIGGTEYRVSAIPFGGYVHMAGEHPEDNENKPLAPGDFNSKPTWQRALVAVAGPVANFATAMLFLWIVFIIGVEKPLYLKRPVVGAVADSSAAKYAGILPGDSITSINQIAIKSWEDVEEYFTLRSGTCAVRFVRNGAPDSVTILMPRIKGRGIPKKPISGLYASFPPVIGALNPDSPGEKAGLLPKDVVVSINERPVISWFQLTEKVVHFDSMEGPLRFVVLRDTIYIKATIMPQFKKEAGRYLVGISVANPPTERKRYSPVSALSPMLKKTKEYTVMIFDVLVKLVSKQVSPQQLAGPVGIVQMSGVVAMGGVSPILDFMALIGINLAVLNLFPLIITDGGLLLFLLLETIRRKPLAIKSQMLINRIAIAFFITLFLYVTFNDVVRIPELFRLMK
jgi:regulator of sigma E protease